MLPSSDADARRLLFEIEKPGRYSGGEFGQIVKTSTFKVAIAFPDVYEIAMSNLAVRILYDLVNSRSDMAAERVFAPWLDMEQSIRRSGSHLFSLETNCPISTFQVLAFSVPHELNFTNVLQMIDLSGMPLRGEYRKEEHPIVMAGGLGVCNPAPLYPFIDAFVYGEAEVSFPRLLNMVKEGREMGSSRAEILATLSQDSTTYVPLIHGSPSQARQGVARREWDPNFDQGEGIPVKDIVPYMGTTQDRIPLEIMRGCTRGCRFCLAGFYYRPRRERSPDLLAERAEEWLRMTGHEQISLLSLSSSDYRGFSELIGRLTPLCQSNSVTLSIPSVRADSISQGDLKALSSLGKFSLTLAPEAGSQRLRDRINKAITDEQIASLISTASSLGRRSVKLYFMVGLPGEEETDLEAIVSMLASLTATRGPKIHVNLGCFVPKPHTPFQWANFAGGHGLKDKLDYLMDRLRPLRKIRWGIPTVKMTVLEAMLARGDEEMASIVEAAYENGARFDGWVEQFRSDVWEGVIGSDLLSANVDTPPWQPGEKTRLPWDILDTGVSPAFLRREWERAESLSPSPYCEEEECIHCGIGCSPSTAREHPPLGDFQPMKGDLSPSTSAKKIYRVKFSRDEKLQFVSHLDWGRALSRLLRRSGLPICQSAGFARRPKISLGPPLPLGCTSQAEYVDLTLVENISLERILKDLRDACPTGMSVLGGGLLPTQSKSLDATCQGVVYTLKHPTSPSMAPSLEDFSNATEWIICRKRKGKERPLDLKTAVLWLRYSQQERCLLIAGRFGGAASFRPDEFYEHVLKAPKEELLCHPPHRVDVLQRSSTGCLRSMAMTMEQFQLVGNEFAPSSTEEETVSGD